MPFRPKILLIYTGGTIGMIKDFDSGALKAFDFDRLLERIPELRQLDCEISTLSFGKPIDSSNMNLHHWVSMAETIENNYDNFDGFVVLHGSDTMSYSASALSFMLEGLSKPVIFTGSQLPIGDLRTDAKENLITAIQVASLHKSGGPVVREVCLYFEYKLYRGNRTTKINAEHFNAFSSPNYPPLAESGVHLKVAEDLLYRTENRDFKVHKELNDDVVILKLFPGISKTVLQSVVAIPGIRGLVLETYGSGNAPTDEWFISELRNAIDRGISVLNVTQCSGGSVSMGQYETSTQLRDIGVISGNDLTTEAAVTKLMYLLTKSETNVNELLQVSLRGEMS